MADHLGTFVHAPIDVVYAFFDDPANTLRFNVHAVRLDVVATDPDGRRTFDVLMRAETGEWMQTIEQVLREPPSRLVTRGGSWTTDRHRWLLTVITDRRFAAQGDGTRIDVTIETKLDNPLRRPTQALQNWSNRGAARAEFERQLQAMARQIEADHGPG